MGPLTLRAAQGRPFTRLIHQQDNLDALSATGTGAPLIWHVSQRVARLVGGTPMVTRTGAPAYSCHPRSGRVIGRAGLYVCLIRRFVYGCRSFPGEQNSLARSQCCPSFPATRVHSMTARGNRRPPRRAACIDTDCEECRRQSVISAGACIPKGQQRSNPAARSWARRSLMEVPLAQGPLVWVAVLAHGDIT